MCLHSLKVVHVIVLLLDQTVNHRMTRESGQLGPGANVPGGGMAEVVGVVVSLLDLAVLEHLDDARPGVFPMGASQLGFWAFRWRAAARFLAA
jgi:hypothetical protein